MVKATGTHPVAAPQAHKDLLQQAEHVTMTHTPAPTTTLPLVDLELVAFLDEFPATPITAETLPMFRQALDAAPRRAVAAPEVEVSERYLPGPQAAPDVRVLVYRPKAARYPLPALLWLHGGGFVLRSADDDDARIKAWVAEVGCVAVSVDYRLAPETPFPGALEDCYAALKWLYKNAADLEVDASRVAVGGLSAGGGLAAALSLLARDRGEVPLVFQLLMYPMLDDRTATSTDVNSYTGEFIWTRESNRFGWASLLGDRLGRAGVSPYAAPARAEQFSGLPPTFIGVGALDLLVAENLEYARRLLQAGVPTELHVYPGAYHAFDMVKSAAVARTFDHEVTSALRRKLGLD